MKLRSTEPGQGWGPSRRNRRRTTSAVRSIRGVVVLVLVWLIWFGCAKTPTERAWRLDLRVADGYADQRDYDAAWTAYEALLPEAPTPHDERYITFRFGIIQEHRGNYDSALDYYQRLLEHHELYEDLDEWTPRGIFRMGLILYDELDRQDEAVELWKTLVRYYPNYGGPAIRSLTCLLVHWERTDRGDEAARFLADEYQNLRQTDMGDNMLYQLGLVLRNQLHQPREAIEIFMRLREEYFESGTRGEADWEIVEILHELEEWEAEIGWLDNLRLEREDGLLGPTVTANMEYAAYRIGLIWRDHMNEPERAIDEFESFLATYRYSLQRDNAAYELVRTTHSLGDRERTRAACAYFLEHFYESRFVPDVEAIATSLDAEEIREELGL